MKKLISLLVVGSLCCAAGAYADDETALNQAMRALDARAKSAADKKLVLTAVSQQTQVPEKTLETQLRTSHLSYGQLLAADSLASATGTSLENILARRAKSTGWAALSKELKIAPASIVNRVRNAQKTVQAAQESMAKNKNMKQSNTVDPAKAISTPPPMPYKMGPGN
jgi:hypothetical protein